MLLISLQSAGDSTVESGNMSSITYSASALDNFVEEISFDIDGNVHYLLTGWFIIVRFWILFAPSTGLDSAHSYESCLNATNNVYTSSYKM